MTLLLLLLIWCFTPERAAWRKVLFLVILGAGLVFGWKEALYALITLYVSGLVAETTLAQKELEYYQTVFEHNYALAYLDFLGTNPETQTP